MVWEVLLSKSGLQASSLSALSLREPDLLHESVELTTSAVLVVADAMKVPLGFHRLST